MIRLPLLLAWVLLSSCGVVGAPVAPETIGVAPVIERQKIQEEALREKRKEATGAAEIDETDPVPLAQDEELLPLRPVGTR